MTQGRGPSGKVKERRGTFVPVVYYYEAGQRKERWLPRCKTICAAPGLNPMPG